MLSTQAEYYSFLVVVFFAFWLGRRSRSTTMAVILTANLLFYSHWGLLYLVLIPGCATVDFFIARGLARSSVYPQRRWLVALSVTMNLGLIVTSRYVPALGPLLPLSLSFYAFQALTYTLEIYRGEAKPAASFVDYLASVTFFPTVIAGPIARVPALIPQWRWKGKELGQAEGGRALGLISLGLLKKFLIADYLASNLVNRVFDLPKLYASGDVLVAVYSYAFQLYYDFSGYSDIAIGSALLLGIRLPENFNQPYRAINLADFWRRWHISFSSWLRDNIYYSLPGRRTNWMPVLGLVITMALGGIWHGLAWTFLIWGLWHGIGLAVVRLWQMQRRPSTEWKRIAAGVMTFHFVLVGWIFFRAASVETALQILGRISTVRIIPEGVSAAYFGVLAIAAVAHYVPNNWRDQCLAWFSARPALVQAAALIFTAVMIRYAAGAGGAAPFIYSRF